MPPAAAQVQLDALLLRGRLPDLVLRPGQVLAARVLERHGRQGLLSLAGAALTAELPDEVAAGDRLRLTVQEPAGDRVVLKLTDPPPPPAAPPVQIPLPDGRLAGVRVEEGEHGGEGEEGSDSVALTYASPALGDVELHLTLRDGALSASVRVGAAAMPLASEGADALRESLAAAASRPAQVSVTLRRDPVDVYA